MSADWIHRIESPLDVGRPPSVERSRRSHRKERGEESEKRDRFERRGSGADDPWALDYFEPGDEGDSES